VIWLGFTLAMAEGILLLFIRETIGGDWNGD
jgi:hypothetical protein